MELGHNADQGESGDCSVDEVGDNWSANIIELILLIGNLCKFIGETTCFVSDEITQIQIFKDLCIYLFEVLHRFQHCTDHITMGSCEG